MNLLFAVCLALLGSGFLVIEQFQVEGVPTSGRKREVWRGQARTLIGRVQSYMAEMERNKATYLIFEGAVRMTSKITQVSESTIRDIARE